MENYSLADIGAVTGNDGFGNNGAWVLIILFAMIFGWGGMGNRGNTDGVTEGGLSDAMNFNNLQNEVGRLSDSLNAQTGSLSNGLSAMGYETLQNFNATQRQIAEGFAGLNANLCQNTQKVLDAITQNRMADMQNRINQLELAQAMQGVVRYPMSYAYNAGASPFCGGGQCCNI